MAMTIGKSKPVRWLFFAFSIVVSYFAIRDAFWWGWVPRVGIELSAVVVYLCFGAAFDYFVKHLRMLVLSVIILTSAFMILLFVEGIIERNSQLALESGMTISGCIYAITHVCRLRAQTRHV